MKHWILVSTLGSLCSVSVVACTGASTTADVVDSATQDALAVDQVGSDSGVPDATTSEGGFDAAADAVLADTTQLEIGPADAPQADAVPMDATSADAPPDAVADANLEQLCTSTGGTVSMDLCCASVTEFPNSCLIGACSCAPSGSHNVMTCSCPTGQCFGANGCQAH